MHPIVQELSADYLDLFFIFQFWTFPDVLLGTMRCPGSK